MPMNKETNQIGQRATLSSGTQISVLVTVNRPVPDGGSVHVFIDREDGQGKVPLGTAIRLGDSQQFRYAHTVSSGPHVYYSRVEIGSYVGPFSLAYRVSGPSSGGGSGQGLLLETGGNINDESAQSILLET